LIIFGFPVRGAPDPDLPIAAALPAIQARARTSLQMLLFLEPLKARLTHIHWTSHAIKPETGEDTLNLAIVFLNWFEADTSDVPAGWPGAESGREEGHRLASFDSAPRFPDFDADGTGQVKDDLGAVRERKLHDS
jgi:hypothetical protein